MNEQKGLPHDIAEVLPFYAVNWPLVVALVVGFMVLILLARYLWRRFKRPRTVANVPAAPADPWAELSSRHRRLAIAENFSAKEQRDYVFQLSLIFREAVELATGIRATDMTSRELQTALQQAHRFSTEDLDAMMGFLNGADLVKFAERSVSMDEAKKFYSFVDAWLLKLKPKLLPSQDVRGQR